MRFAVRKPRTVLILALLAVFVLSASFLPLEQMATGLQGWVEANESWAFLIVFVCITLGILLMLPASLMMMLAGYLFGLAQGFAAVWIAGLIASTAAFLIGRSIARPWIERKFRRKTSFMAMARAIRRKGFLVVLLLSLFI